MSTPDERVDQAMAELKRVDDARLAPLVKGRAADAMFEEVVGMDPASEEQRAHAGRGGQTRRPASRRLWRVGVVVAMVAAVVVALAVADPFGSKRLTVVQQAAAALTPDGGVILHHKMLGAQTSLDGDVVTWSVESWQTTSEPVDWRRIETSINGVVSETARLGNVSQLYDPSTDTVCMLKIDPAPEQAPAPDAAQRPPESAQEQADPFRAKLVALLRSGHVREDGRLTIDGHEAIKLVNTVKHDHEVYIIDAATYAPIELRTTGDRGEVVLRYVIYETLSDTSANRSLLDIKVQHPGAQVHTDLAHFQQMFGRLFDNE